MATSSPIAVLWVLWRGVLQRRASAPGVGLLHAARSVHGNSRLWTCGQRSRFATLRSRVAHMSTGATTARKGFKRSADCGRHLYCHPRTGRGTWNWRESLLADPDSCPTDGDHLSPTCHFLRG